MSTEREVRNEKITKWNKKNMEKYKIYNSNMTLLFYLGYLTIKENEFGTLKFVTQNEVIRKVYSDYFLEYIKRKAQIITSTIDTEKIVEEL